MKAITFLTVLLLASCGDGSSQVCAPGQQTICTCPSGTSGLQECLSDGSGYGVCSHCVCSSGQMIACTCPNGDSGLQTCLTDGSGYGECSPCCTAERPLCNGSCLECPTGQMPYCDTNGEGICCPSDSPVFCDSSVEGWNPGEILGQCHGCYHQGTSSLDCGDVAHANQFRCDDANMCWICPGAYNMDCTGGTCVIAD